MDWAELKAAAREENNEKSRRMSDFADHISKMPPLPVYLKNKENSFHVKPKEI